MQEGARADKNQGARLTRYAAALPLDIAHKRALVQSAAARNMEVQNNRCMLDACLASDGYIGKSQTASQYLVTQILGHLWTVSSAQP